MRILFLATIVPYPPHGGVYQRTFNILKRVAAVHEVIFIGFEKTESDKQNIEYIRKLCHEAYSYRLPDDWKKSAFIFGLLRNLVNIRPYTCQKYHLDTVARFISEKIQNREIDLLHIDITDLATYGDYAADIPKVLTHHNINSQLWASQAQAEQNLLKKWYMGLQSLKFRKIEKRYVPRYDINVSVSSQEGLFLEKFVPREKIRLVPNGVDIDYFKPTDRGLEEDFQVIYAGSPNYYPNAVAIQWWCDKIIPILKEKGLHDVTLTILGGREKASGTILKYLDKAKNYNLRVLGFVDDIRPYIARASVYIVPLQSGGGTRLKVLDALAMGKALLSTSVGCEGISVSHGENILIADSPEQFAGELELLLTDKVLRNRLGENGRKLVERHYSWDRICEDMLEIYPRLVKDVPKA